MNIMHLSLIKVLISLKKSKEKNTDPKLLSVCRECLNSCNYYLSNWSNEVLSRLSKLSNISARNRFWTAFSGTVMGCASLRMNRLNDSSTIQSKRGLTLIRGVSSTRLCLFPCSKMARWSTTKWRFLKHFLKTF